MEGYVGPDVFEIRHEEATAGRRFRTQDVKIVVTIWLLLGLAARGATQI